MKHLANKRGVALIGAVAALMILSILGVVVVSMVGKQSYSAIHQAQSDQAFALAEAGAYRALSYLSREDGECVELSDALQFSNVSLGEGTFTVTGTRYNPTPTFLTAGIGTTDTTIPVVSTANYASHGIITIGTENIHYSGTTPTSFTGARRGASGTTAATHLTTSANAVVDWTLSESVDWAIGAVALTKDAGAPSIDFDASGSVVQNTAASSFVWSHTVSGGNRVLVVGVSIRKLTNEVVSSVTYAGNPLTLVGAQDDESSVRVEIWRLVAPPTGTNNVVVTLSSPTKIVGGSASLTGVDQASPIAASDFATGSSTNPTLTLAAVDTTAWVVDFLAFRSTGQSTPSATVGNGRVQRVSGYTESGVDLVNVRAKASTGQAGGVLQDQCLITSTGAVGPGANQSTGITFDKLTNFQQDSCDPCEWTHTVSPDGTDKILVVSFGYGDDLNPIVGVTYNSIALTEIRTEIYPGGRITSMWYLVNPPTGDNTVSVDLLSNTQNLSGSSASYAGVDQTNPVEAANVGGQGNSGTSSVDITTTNEGAWIIDSHNAGSNWSMAGNTGRVERWNRKNGIYTDAGSTMKTTTPGTYSLNWTESASTTAPWVIVGAALKPAEINQPTNTLGGPAQRVVEIVVRSP